MDGDTMDRCSCCGSNIKDGQKYCKICELIHKSNKTRVSNLIFRKLVVVSILSIFAIIFLTGCDPRTEDFSVGGATFTCIELDSNGNCIFVHDKTGVLYVRQSNGKGTFPLLNADGSSYTLEQYTKDKGDARVYRDLQ